VVVRIALVGGENDSYPSHRALNAARGLLGDDVQAGWLPTDAPKAHDRMGFDGIWLVPGSPYADDAAAYAAVTWARQHDVPFPGTCGGLQYAVIEYLRNVLGVPGASHAESDGISGSNVISTLACSLHGQERVVRPVPGTRFDQLVGGESLAGMHYCNYGPGPDPLARPAPAACSSGRPPMTRTPRCWSRRPTGSSCLRSSSRRSARNRAGRYIRSCRNSSGALARGEQAGHDQGDTVGAG